MVEFNAGTVNAIATLRPCTRANGRGGARQPEARGGGAIPVDKLVTATFDLSAAVEAFVVARQREQVKAHLTVS